MNIKALMMTCGLAVCLLAQPVVADPLEDGQNAYDSKDYATALKLLRALSEQGDASAQHRLGLMYESGQGVPKDFTEARKWYRKAADQGVALAQIKLGYMYQGGEGMPQDYAEGVKWYRKAADQGVALAQIKLGYTYFEGKGVPEDYVQAHMWWNLAAAGYPPSETENRDKAARNRDNIAARMTPEQIAEAQRLAQEWRAAHCKK